MQIGNIRTKKNYEKLVIYFIPNDYLNENSQNTVGDKRWFCISYQLLYDNILIPVQNHSSLTATAKLIIEQYVKNMRLTNKGIKMASTQEEKELIINIYEKYQDVFENIFEVLALEGKIDEVPNKAKSSGRGCGKISFEFDNQIITGDSASDVLEKVLKQIVDNEKIMKIPLPWGKGTQRYILSNEQYPVHINVRDFFLPIKYKSYTIEAHMDRNRTIQVISKIANKIEVNFKIIEL